MVTTITYATGTRTVRYLNTVSNGGTVWSSDLVGNATFDYFSDSPAVNDAIYFATDTDISKINLNVGTAIAGTDIVLKWEFYQRDLSAYGGTAEGWYEIPNFEDDTNGLTTTGANSFKFGLPYGWYETALNGGTSRLWIRCRLHSFTTVTEGGANTTTAVSMNTATVTVSGSTDLAPATFTEIADYLETNAPWLGKIQDANGIGRKHFDLKQVSLDLNSATLSLNETIETGFFGRDAGSNGYFDLRNLTMGELIGTKFAKNGSTFIMHQGQNSSYVSLTGWKAYGSHIVGGIPNSGWGYPSWQVECVMCYLENINFTPHPLGDINNCTIYNPGIWIFQSGFFNTFNDNKMIIYTNTGFKALGLLYSTGFEIKNLSWEVTDNSYLQFLYFYNSAPHPNVVWDFINPSPSLPDNVNANVRMFQRTTSTAGFTIDRCYFYDNSTGTYTDYSTEINDATLDDVPIHGEVGDIIYFGDSGNMQTISPWFKFITSNTSNDYEYVWEYWHSAGGWQLAETIDLTDNFTKSYNDLTGDGYTYLTRNDPYVVAYPTTVNGFTGYWNRLRIVAKGTGTPTLSQGWWRTETGAGKWNAYEKYSLDIKILNSNGVAIQSATVAVDYNGVNQFSVSTDANGDITQQKLALKHWYFDPENSWNEYGRIAQIDYGNYDLTVSKSGYETYTGKITMNSKKELVIELKDAISVMTTTDSKIAIKLDPSNSTVNRDKVIIA